MTTRLGPGRSGWPRRGDLRRPGAAAALAILTVAYVAVYLAWLVFRWGGPELETTINDASFIPLGLLAITFALRAARQARTTGGRHAWLLFGLAFAAYCAGDILWFDQEIVLGIVVPYPSVADIGYLAFYPFLLLGLISLPRERAENRLKTFLDLATVFIGSGTVVWWLVLAPVAAANSSGGIATVVALAYPVGDLLVIFALAAALMVRLTDTSRRALALLGAGLILNVIADFSYARLSLEATYQSGAWLDVLYGLGWVAMILAAFLQVRGVAEVRRTGVAPVPTRALPFLPYVAVAAVYGLLAVATQGYSDSARVLVIGAIAVTTLVVARQVLTARENARLLAERASSRSEARFQAIIQNANDVIAVVDREGTIGYVTPSVAHLSGRPAESFLGRGLGMLLEPADVPLALELLRTAAARPGTSDTIQCRVRSLTGDPRHVETSVMNLLDDPVVVGLVVTIHDVTERRRFEEQLRDQAFHDPLTGLANRALLADRIAHGLRRGRRRTAQAALLYLDLDDFKQVNGSLGHAAGDRVLVEVARRLGGAIRAEDTAARLGGDEFAVLVDETLAVGDAIEVTERILAELGRPIEIDGTAVVIGASVGIVRAETRGSEPVDLLRNAVFAMYQAKGDARGSYRIFQPAMFAATVERIQLEADLRTALDAGELGLVFQPLVDLSDERMVGVEALLRWDHPTKGLIMPALFIPLAEQTGEIERIGRWVIERTCLTVGGWNEASANGPLRANVNVSARQLDPRLVDDVAGILQRTGFPPELLVLEITESVFAAERPGVREVLSSLRSLGVRISIDDFGTGYSSLSFLRDLPVDELKIDRAFIQALTEHGDTSLVAAIIKLAHDFDLATVAEGIEIASQITALRELGCDLGQGYLLGRPTSPSAIEERLAAEPGGAPHAYPRSA